MNNLQHLYDTNKDFHAFVTSHLTIFEKWYTEELEGMTIDDDVEADKWLMAPSSGSDYNDRDELEYKMSALIGSLSNGKITKPYVDNAVIASVITEEFEAAFDEERAQLVNDLETMKNYTSKVRDMLVKVYGFAVWLLDGIPDDEKTAGDLKDMNSFYRDLKALGIEV